MDRRELNKMFDALAPDPQRERELLQKLLQDDARRKRPMKNWKRVVVGVAAAALLVTGATAAYQIFRKEVPLEPDKTVPGMLGSGQTAWEQTYVDEGAANPIYWPNREVVEVDPARAQALLGDYLPECGYQWQIEDYTLTVGGYVLDEHTGAAKFYYTVEHPGGFGNGAVDWEHGWLNNELFRVNVTFETQSDVSRPWFGGRWYVDVEQSTEEKLCVVNSAASDGGWKAEDGFIVSFTVRGESGKDDDEISAKLELPGLKSLPAVSVTDPATGETAAELSCIGLLLSPGGDMDEVDYIALDYTDGTRYVVRDDANGLDNTDHGLISGERPDRDLRLVFNRLVDPSQVVSITVDGHRYEVNR